MLLLVIASGRGMGGGARESPSPRHGAGSALAITSPPISRLAWTRASIWRRSISHVASVHEM